MEQWPVDPELDTSPRCAHLVGTLHGVCPERMWVEECASACDVGRCNVCCSASDVVAFVAGLESRVCFLRMSNHCGFGWLCENACDAHVQ